MKVAKLQHNTYPFHSKRHNTYCLETHKAHHPVFFGTIVSFHMSPLVIVPFSTLVLDYGQKLASLLHLKNVSSMSTYVFYTLIF